MSENLSNDPCNCEACTAKKANTTDADVRETLAKVHRSAATLESLTKNTLPISDPSTLLPAVKEQIEILSTLFDLVHSPAEPFDGLGYLADSLRLVQLVVASGGCPCSLGSCDCVHRVHSDAGHDSSPSVGDSTGTPEPTEGGAVRLVFSEADMGILDAAMGALDEQIHSEPFPYDPSPTDVNRLWAWIKAGRA